MLASFAKQHVADPKVQSSRSHGDIGRGFADLTSVQLHPGLDVRGRHSRYERHHQSVRGVAGGQAGGPQQTLATGHCILQVNISLLKQVQELRSSSTLFGYF